MPSQSHKVFKTMVDDDEIPEHLKYSESMSTLKRLRNADEESKNRPSSSVFKKGTSEFLKRRLM